MRPRGLRGEGPQWSRPALYALAISDDVGEYRDKDDACYRHTKQPKNSSPHCAAAALQRAKVFREPQIDRWTLFLGRTVAGNAPYSNAKVEGHHRAFRTPENGLDVAWLPPQLMLLEQRPG